MGNEQTREAWRRDTDNGGEHRVDVERRADDLGRLCEALPPEAVADYSDDAIMAVVIRAEGTAERHRDAERVEEVRCDQRPEHRIVAGVDTDRKAFIGPPRQM